MQNDQINTVHETVIADANTDAIDVRQYRGGFVQLEATLVDVNTNLTSPTLDIDIETSIDGVNWDSLTTAVAFTQLTTTGREVKRIVMNELTMFIRYQLNLGGTGYEAAAVDPADNAYWDITLKAILSD